MTDARAEIFTAVRRSLGVNGREAPRRAAIADRLANSPAGPVPARGSGSDRLAVFQAEAERSFATFAVVAAHSDVPEEVGRFLRENNFPHRLRMGVDPVLAKMGWDAATFDVAIGRSFGDDATSVSRAFAAVAETGSLVLTGGTDNPTTLNFLADNHIIVIDAEDVVDAFESVWRRVREKFGKGSMPRALNFVTGPSRSADIEQTMLLGAHGPRTLHIILVGGALNG